MIIIIEACGSNEDPRAEEKNKIWGRYKSDKRE